MASLRLIRFVLSARLRGLIKKNGDATPARAIVITVVLFVLVFSIQILAVVPIDSGGASNFMPVIINGDPGDQFFAHIDGDIAPYAAPGPNGLSQVNYYNFFTGETHVVPRPAGTTEVLDYWPDVSGNKISFWRQEVTYPNISEAILVYDIATGVTTEVRRLGPGVTYSGQLLFPAIGGNTVAYWDTNAPGSGYGEVYVANLSNLSAAPIRLTNNAGTADDRMENYIRVSPSGNVIVWQSCPVSGSYNCDIEKAMFNGSTWTTSRITSTTESEQWPNIDGTLIVYDRYTVPNYDHSQVCWQPAAGGTEQCLEMDGSQKTPAVSSGVIAFSSTPTGGTQADLYAYEVGTNRLFRITRTDYPLSEDLSEITRLPDGRFRMVWDDGNCTTWPVCSRDVYGATFELPAVNTPFNFSGFLQPVDPYPTLNVMKAGGAVPVRFSLGGFQGLSIFASGFPKSQVINCGTSVLQADIEQTVTAGNSSLSYDATTDQYSYVWKTDKSWVGTCRQLTIRFTDNTDYLANFKFK